MPNAASVSTDRRFEWTFRFARLFGLNTPHGSQAVLRVLIALRILSVAQTIRIDKNSGLWFATDSLGRDFFAPNYWRCRRYLRRSALSYGEHLFQKYCLDEELRPGDVLIDVGANCGELSLAALERGCIVLSIEPDPNAFAALERNLATYDDSVRFAVAASNSTGRAVLHISTDSADSSIIPPQWRLLGRATVRVVPTSRLDDLVPQVPLAQDRQMVLKVEAEGFEPEVLAGASTLIQGQVHFVAVDAGPERLGKDTIRETTQFLTKAGFATCLRVNNIVTGSGSRS